MRRREQTDVDQHPNAWLQFKLVFNVLVVTSFALTKSIEIASLHASCAVVDHT